MLQDYQTKPRVYYFSFRVHGSFTKPLNSALFLKNILTNKTFLAMKNSFLFNFRNPLKNLLSKQILVIALLLGISSQFDLLHAQNNNARLSVQGILKKASGEAVDDGVYSLTFSLYTDSTTNISVWTETQPSVEIVSGIYSAVLGNVTNFMIPFNQIYYLGVRAGGSEMKPRVQLTSAPYALALIGSTNQFPSSGIVKADSIRVATGVLARGGAPGDNGASKNGYAFTGNMGDKDSGLFSTAPGQVSMYVNNATMLTATPDSVAIRRDLRLNKDANINYNGLDDWRLVETDYFQNPNDFEGWLAYVKVNDFIGWNSILSGNPILAGNNNDFHGQYITTGDNDNVLKKTFNLPTTAVGDYNYIKIKFHYYYIDIWAGDNDEDRGFGAIAETVNGTGMVIGYTFEGKSTQYYHDFNTGAFNVANNWAGGSGTDFIDNGEMTFHKCTSCNGTFVAMFGAANNNGADSYGIGMVEVWVK